MRKSVIKTILFIILLCSFSDTLLSQERDIVPYLKLIESGAKDSVLQILPGLEKSYPNDPSVLFLQAILSENAQDAIPVYDRIIKDFPKSKYADASVYRLYSYYYSIGLYNTAAAFLGKLKKEYPDSPYIKSAEREIPEINEPSPPEQEITAGDNKADFRFTIQAGAFSNDSNAASLKKSFEDAGYYSFIKDKSVGGTDFKVVYVGRFGKRDEAESFLQVVNKQFDLDGHIVALN
jgi:tetratricopeptide (TPR) repeat protein